MTGFTASDVPDQSGRTILITGANSGIGFEAAKVLAATGAQVILGCRDNARGRAAAAAINGEMPAARLRVIELDLGNMASIHAAAEQVERVDVLINNAGIMRPPHGFTNDGFEQQLGINHLGHFALTGLLLSRISGPDPRVVTLASIAHRRGTIDFANLDGRKRYSAMQFYCQSKLANLLFMAELDRRLRVAGSPVKSIGCHPGISGTGLARYSWIDKVGFKAANLLFHRPPQAAQPTLQAACDPTAQGGDYFGPQGFMEASGPSGPARRSRKASDPELARRLWQVSVELTGIDPVA